MKKKTLLTLLLFSFAIFSTSCTLHFKGKEIELDTESKDVGIVNTEPTNHTYELAKVDIFKNAGPEN